MKCWAGVGLFKAGVLGNSRLSDTARPLRTSDAARTRLSAVIRLTAPSWSSAPQRPQLRRSRRYDSTSALVGMGRSGTMHLLLTHSLRSSQTGTVAGAAAHT